MDEPSSEGRKNRHVHKPTCIDDFDIIKPISRGAFGQVFLARRRDKDKQFYAVKVVKKTDVVNKNMIEQVVAERDALAISKSPFIVNLFYSFQSKDKIFLVMEYLIGGDCKSLLHNLGYFDEEMSRVYIAQVVLALEYLHNHGIIHRDIKPDNLLISDEGKIKLTDFGLSRLTMERKPSFIDVMSTPSVNKCEKASSSFYRTPGQVMSLTSNFTFSLSAAKPINRSRLNSSCLALQQHLSTTPISRDSPVCGRQRLPCATPGGTPKGLGTKKRTQFNSKVSQRTFDINDPPETPFTSADKNVRNRSPEEENILPACKKPRHAGLTAEIDALSLKELRGSAPPREPLREISSFTPQRPTEKQTTTLSFNSISDAPLASSPFNSLKSPMECESPPMNGDKSTSPDGKFLTPPNPGSCASLNLKCDSPRNRTGTIMEYLKEKKQSTPANKRNPCKERAVSAATPLTPLTRRVIGPEVPFTSGYVSETTSEEESDADRGSPADKLKDGTRELNNPAKTEKFNASGSSGFNESPHNTLGAQTASSWSGHSDINCTPTKPIPQASDEVMKTASEKRSSFSERRESGVALLPPSPLVGATTGSRDRCYTIEFEDPPNVSNVNSPHETFSDENSSNCEPSQTRPRSCSIAFETSNHNMQKSEKGHSNLVQEFCMDIISPLGATESPMDVTFKSRASSKGTPAQMDMSQQWHHTSAPLIRTPFRTPKSCRRGKRPQTSPPKNRILGTPDYLAPEILLGQDHTPAVDWWSLGVCLYEFLTGVPPFNDDTPELVFSHIMQRELLWPEGDEALSEIAVGAVESILILHAEHRPGALEIQRLPFFLSLDWSSLHNHPPPFVPRPDDITDTTYFDARNTIQNLRMSSFSH